MHIFYLDIYNNLCLTILCDTHYNKNNNNVGGIKLEKDLLESFLSELRRGTLILCVLSQLQEARYGYALVQTLEDKGIAIDANTLYPLLRRLEKQGLLCSEWNTEEAKPRKYYKRTVYGDSIYHELVEQWKIMSAGMNDLLGGKE